MAFFAHISDPVVGGTYMTLLNTLTNLGGNWPATLSLWFVDPLTIKECTANSSNVCSNLAQQDVSNIQSLFSILQFRISSYVRKKGESVLLGLMDTTLKQ